MTDTNSEIKLILVDDDKFLLDMYALKFKNSGVDVTAFARAEDAVAAMREGLKPAALVLDLIMPGMDGMQLLEAVKKDDLAPGAALIVLSNQGQPSDIGKAKELGADGYIVKATTIPSEVVGKVMAILKAKKKS